VSGQGELSRRQMIGLSAGAIAGVATGGLVTWRLTRIGEPVPPSMWARSDLPAPEPDPETVEPDPGVVDDPPAAPSIPDLRPYRNVWGEVFPDAKLVGVQLVEALMLYDASEQPADVVDRALVLASSGVDANTLSRDAGPLFIAGVESVAEVVYPQLGGLHPHNAPVAASIMVVVRQHLGSGDATSVVSRCIDVRVAKFGSEWLVEGLEDTSGEPVTEPADLSDEALRVLEHPDIDMPDSVRWDIYEGIVDRRILNEMADLADQVSIGVTTCMRGHPVNVFGTAGRSAHSVGRAVDIWRVGESPVVQQHTDVTSVAYSVSEDLYQSRRINRLGAPWAFGAGSWTDPVHKDHLHLGVS
jgi:hypothetical protein